MTKATGGKIFEGTGLNLELNDILERIPHRPPFLFVDRLENLQPGISATGLTMFPKESPIFGGHFPGEPIVPGVLLIECVAQVAALIFANRGSSQPDDSGFRGKYLAKVERVIFKKPVYPGETVRTEVRLVKRLGNLVKVSGRIESADTVVMEGDIILYDADPQKIGQPE